MVSWRTVGPMTTQTKARREEIAHARETLLEQYKLTPGSTVWTTTSHVSRSGMSRVMDVHVIRNNEPLRITWSVADAVDWRYDQRYEGVKVDGCGMDMGFHLVYTLSQVLYPEGFGCIGEGCPSNDHSNGDRDYTPHLTIVLARDVLEGLGYNVLHDARGLATGRFERYHWHCSGGYALKQRWL